MWKFVASLLQPRYYIKTCTLMCVAYALKASPPKITQLVLP